MDNKEEKMDYSEKEKMEYTQKEEYKKGPKMEDNHYSHKGEAPRFSAKGPAVAAQLKGSLANKFMEQRYKHFMPYKDNKKSE